MFKRMTSRLARMGLTYHDAIADTGIYDQAISRLPPHMQVRGGRRGGRGCGGRGGARQGCFRMQETCRWLSAVMAQRPAGLCWVPARGPQPVASPACERITSDDLLSPLVMPPANSLCSPQEERQRRMTRALDMSAKHTEMAVQVSARSTLAAAFVGPTFGYSSKPHSLCRLFPTPLHPHRPNRRRRTRGASTRRWRRCLRTRRRSTTRSASSTSSGGACGLGRVLQRWADASTPAGQAQ
jgi:hypothetical protein